MAVLGAWAYEPTLVMRQLEVLRLWNVCETAEDRHMELQLHSLEPARFAKKRLLPPRSHLPKLRDLEMLAYGWKALCLLLCSEQLRTEYTDVRISFTFTDGQCSEYLNDHGDVFLAFLAFLALRALTRCAHE
jgi:hypothetical protein